MAVPFHAEVLPQSFGGDPRIPEVRHGANEALNLDGVVGYHLHLELQEGETFANLCAGDTAAIEVGAEGRHLMLKPKEETVATNLILLTNKHGHTIGYTARRGRDLRLAVYLVRFPVSGDSQGEGIEPVPTAALRNLDSWACGAAELKPVEVSDDGVDSSIHSFAAPHDGAERNFSGGAPGKPGWHGGLAATIAVFGATPGIVANSSGK